mmetsp:Transcript_15517/g.19926  ORF Transcript_15517/g.19926 Transcript_15517/m.19926 type:complete len:175 (-) Transcript_15517:575-1099(-)
MVKEEKTSKATARSRTENIADLEDLFLEHNDSLESFRIDLISWYRKNRRRLPWRGDEPPYGVSVKEAPVVKNEKVGAYGTWVSEVMLQQTRVETVIKYFLNWMQLFPDEQTLAQASPDAVNAAWAGLGYYSRARNLQKGAKKVVEDFNGVLPDSESGLLSIPGIGFPSKPKIPS